MRDYQTILMQRAAGVLDDDKPLDHIQMANRQNLKDYAERRLRHSLGLSTFQVEPSWFQKLLRRST